MIDVEKAKEQGDEFLWNQFCRLGEMLGDGLGDEPDGKWIGKEYKRIAIQLGVAKPSDFRKHRENHSEQINEFMEKRVKDVRCKYCGGELKQVRKGSFVAKCQCCSGKFKLGRCK